MTEFDPFDKIEDIISKISAYDLQITKGSDFWEAKLISAHNEELWIVIDEEFTIFFGDWHEHFSPYEDEYALFLNDLFDILNNRKFTICAYRKNRWCGSQLSECDTPDESVLREDWGNDKTIKCNYWDKSKNIVLEPKVKIPFYNI